MRVDYITFLKSTNFTAISMYGAEFHANEVCQQCDNLNVFKQTKEECTNLLLL